MRRPALVAAALCACLAATTAEASQVRIARGTVVFTAAAGEANAVNVSAINNGLRLRDAGAVLDVSSPCRPLSMHEAVCRWGANGGDNALVAELGDGDDSITIGSSFVEPVPGLTVEEGLDGPAVLRGGSGDDAIVGGWEVDEIDGGLGSDRIDGGSGPNVLHYNGRTRSVTVDLLQGVGGEPGEMDDLSNIEFAEGGRAGDTMIATPHACGDDGNGGLDGGPGDDHLIGSRCGDWLTGQRGDDLIEGRGGDDVLWGDIDCASPRRGSANDDRVSGGRGDDELCERFGRNFLRGGPGEDWLRGGRDRDDFAAGAGSDRVESRDGFSERVSCGRGRDVSDLDIRDRSDGCERRRTYGTDAPSR